jgi:hypothetical protein
MENKENMSNPAEPKLYFTADQGLAAFIWYVNCGDEVFVRVDTPTNGQPVIVFRDDLRDNPCTELKKLYHDGAQLRDVKDFCHCYRAVQGEIRAAYKRRSNKSEIGEASWKRSIPACTLATI